MDEASSNAQVPAPTPALGFSVSVELTPGRNIVMQSHLANDCSQAEIDNLLDKVLRSVERQKLRATEREHLEALRQLEEQQSRQHVSFGDDFMRLDAQQTEKMAKIPPGRRTAAELTPAEKAQRDGARATLEKGKKNLDETRTKIKDFEAKVAAQDAAPTSGE